MLGQDKVKDVHARIEEIRSSANRIRYSDHSDWGKFGIIADALDEIATILTTIVPATKEHTT